MHRGYQFLAVMWMLTLSAACTRGGSDSVDSPAPAVAVATDAPARMPTDPAAIPPAVPTAVGQDQSAAPGPSGTITYVVVPEESQAMYTVSEEFLADALSRLGRDPGQTTTTGTTRGLGGSIALEFTDGVPSVVSGEFTVDISTLTSDAERRDSSIRERWLESASFPTATFVPTAIQGFPADHTSGNPVSFQLLGDLAIRDTTHPVTFEFTGAGKGGEVRGRATTTILMTDYGFSPPDVGGLFTVGNEVLVTLEVALREVP